MFKFDFDIDDEVDDETLDFGSLKITDDVVSAEVKTSLHPCQEVLSSQLLDTLPPVISYSPLQIPLSSNANSLVLARRDLFDARFQLISQGDDQKNALQFFESPSDLVPGVYEGGFKTWECSLDLVDYLEGNGKSACLVGKRILELGCGTAVPTMYLLHKILALPITENQPKTMIHLQDYNASVLELVTLPNLILVWLMSPASISYLKSEAEDDSSDPPDPSKPSELNITPELKTAFLQSLQERNISLRFFSGSWETFNFDILDGTRRYDLVLTSETIYRVESLPSLVNLLRSACGGDQMIEDEACTMCLVATKAVYFGVGGGINDFTQAVQERKGRVESVWETTAGVKRKILSVTWQPEGI